MKPSLPSIEMNPEQLYRTLARVLWLGVGLFLLIWFLDLITGAILFFVFGLILALALNPPVTWLERKGAPRTLAALIVCLGVLGTFAGLVWVMLPTLIEQATELIAALPEYALSLRSRIDQWVTRTPEIEEWIPIEDFDPTSLLPAARSLLMRVGRYSLNLLALVVLTIVLVSTVVYTLANPRPLLEGYLTLFPPHLQEKASRAFSRSSETVVGWLWSNVIVGGLEGVASAIFLTWMGIPGAMLWGILAFFAELIPKLGPYVMTIPPVLIALSIDPAKAAWVLLFYIVMQEIAGDVIAPMVRAKQMKLHPVSTIFAVLAMGSAFGILGALISTPMAGFVKAYYDEFYASRQPPTEECNEWVEKMLDRKAHPKDEDPPDKPEQVAPEGAAGEAEA